MRKVVISGMIGNALEWYDYALYGHCAAIISKLFFPTDDHYVSLMLTYSIFAVGFIMRPLGGVFFGYIGDKYGRRVSLSLAILMMAIPTALIGLLPSYEQIGLLAPIALTIIRLMQGLALGGAFSGCISFVVEHAPDNKRGLAGSTSMFSMCAGIFLGLVFTTFLSNYMGKEVFEDWGWRIPFVISLFIGLIGVYIRKGLNESPKYLEAKENQSISKTPVKEVCKNYLPELIIAIGVYLTVTVPFYTLTVFMTSFMSTVMEHPISDAMLMNSISLVVLMIVIPLASIVSDRIGRKPVLKYSAIAFVIMSYPIFNLLTANSFIEPLLGQIIFAVLLGAYIAPVPATLVELFPTSVRFTGVALSYNISAAIFGGTTPMVAMWLIEKTEMDNALAFYIMLFALFTLFSLKNFKDKFNEPLV